MSNMIATAPTTTTLAQGYTFTYAADETEIIEAIRQLHAAGSAEIALVIVHLSYKKARKLRKNLPDEQADRETSYLLQNIRPLVRKTDRVFLHEHSMYFVLPAANLQGAEIVEERLWEALLWRIHNMNEQEARRPEKLVIGHSAFPVPQASPEELLHSAHETSRCFSGHMVRARSRNLARGMGMEEADLSEEQEELPRLARKLGIPYLTLLPPKLPGRVLQVISARLARELHCYPVGRERNMLTVAMLNPQDHKALERLHQETGLRIFPVLTHPEALEHALEQWVSTSRAGGK